MKHAPFRSLVAFICLSLLASQLSAQVIFEPDYNIVDTKGYRSGVSNAIADVNGDGRDDLVRVTGRNILQVNFGSGNTAELKLEEYDAAIPSEAWNITVGNLDNEGPNEIALGTVYKGGYIFKYNEQSRSLELVQSTSRDFYSQGANFVDMNNDGHLDWFICDDESENEIFLNDGTGMLVESDDFIDMSTHVKSDNSGNYASDWVDIDSDGDLDCYISKCRSAAREETDPRRINQLFINDGENNFTEEAEDFNLAIGAQTWATNFGDLDNDGDLDAIVINHGDNWNLLENIDNKTFVDRPEDINRLHGFAIQCILRDFDNNGYLDILVTGSNQYLWFNYGDFNLELVRNPFRFYTATNFAVGDIDHDGFTDAYVAHTQGYNDPGLVDDLLYINQANDNNWAGFRLVGKSSNHNGIGARLRAYTPTHGWQIRDVRSGESYGIMNSLNSIFGLGSEESIERLEVLWPSGHRDKFTDIEGGKYYTITEGTCIKADEKAIVGNSGIICDDSSIVLQGKKGAYNKWSTGEEVEKIQVTEGGIYTMIARSDDGCETKTPAVNIKMQADLSYEGSINVSAPVECVGAEIKLEAQKGASYKWSTGETSRSIYVNRSDTYEVNIQDRCGAEHLVKRDLIVLDPTPYNIVNDTVGKGATATLKARGKNLKWYQSETEDKEFSTGEMLEMADVQVGQTFYVEGEDEYIFNSEFTGETDWIGTTKYGDVDLNGGMYFEVRENMLLESVEVYTDSIGEREIQIFDENRDTILVRTFDLKVGKNILDIDIEFTPGRNYFITTNVYKNFKTFGYYGPRLQRSNTETNYPYRSSDLLWITNSAFGPQYMHYFYNWKVRKADIHCTSERVPVSIVLDVNTNTEEEDLTKLILYPNPASNSVRIENETKLQIDNIEIYDIMGRAVLRVSNINSSTQEINLSQFPDGTYSLVFNFKEGMSYVKRLIKVN